MDDTTRSAWRVRWHLPWLACAGLAFAGAIAPAVAGDADAGARKTLGAERPAWARPANDLGALGETDAIGRATLVLARPPALQQAFDALLAAQQDPASPHYRQWLTPEEIGARFGPPQADVDAVVEWLASQGLQATGLSANRTRLHFSGSAGAAAAAFGTPLHRYATPKGERVATRSAPTVPAAVAARVKAVAGLTPLRAEPLLRRSAPRPSSSSCTGNRCEHAVFPDDFRAIYNLPASTIDGRGQSIAIVSRSRVADADMRNFQSLAGLPSRLPVTIVPPDGDPPSAAATSCSETGTPSCDDPDDAMMDQLEATLDVQRAGSVAPGATVKLIASGGTSRVDGVYLATEYAIETSPPPARILSLSYGTCEADNSAGAAAYIDDLFAQAAMEGISVFVSSGDAGVSDCADHQEDPQAGEVVSTNLLCASSHATCVGGTQFADTSNPDRWWSRDNGPGFGSALGYIPEGAWNDALDEDGATKLSATGGGVSRYIGRPAWQAGRGVPGHDGRYTPDVSLNASAHTGYFTCAAVLGGSCETTNGHFRYLGMAGTSASAPSMAGIAALLNQSTGSANANLNPRLYALAANPANGVFHDVTVETSGVAHCDVDVPSLCNNTTPGPNGLQGGVRGYVVGGGHDLATGLGSVDVQRLLASWEAPQGGAVDLNQRGLTGSWANAATPSQGIVLSVEEDVRGSGTGLLFGGWFTYDTHAGGGARWYTLQSDPAGTGAAESALAIYRTEGGRLDSPQPASTVQVGHATLAVADCSHATLDYAFTDGSGRSGTIPLARLLSDVTCLAAGQTGSGATGRAAGNPDVTRTAHTLAGAWADPATSGQGLVLDIDPVGNVLFGAWYTFSSSATAGSGGAGQRWYTLQASVVPGSGEVRDLVIYESTGGAFDASAATSTHAVGTGTLDFHDCTTATLAYRFNGGSAGTHSGTLSLARVSPPPQACRYR
jgi:hypothetical protein